MVAFSKIKDQLGDRLTPKGVVFTAATGVIIWKLLRAHAASRKKQQYVDHFPQVPYFIKFVLSISFHSLHYDYKND